MEIDLNFVETEDSQLYSLRFLCKWSIRFIDMTNKVDYYFSTIVGVLQTLFVMVVVVLQKSKQPGATR